MKKASRAWEALLDLDTNAKPLHGGHSDLSQAQMAPHLEELSKEKCRKWLPHGHGILLLILFRFSSVYRNSAICQARNFPPVSTV